MRGDSPEAEVQRAKSLTAAKQRASKKRLVPPPEGAAWRDACFSGSSDQGDVLLVTPWEEAVFGCYAMTRAASHPHGGWPDWAFAVKTADWIAVLTARATEQTLVQGDVTLQGAVESFELSVEGGLLCGPPKQGRVGMLNHNGAGLVELRYVSSLRKRRGEMRFVAADDGVLLATTPLCVAGSPARFACETIEAMRRRRSRRSLGFAFAPVFAPEEPALSKFADHHGQAPLTAMAVVGLMLTAVFFELESAGGGA